MDKEALEGLSEALAAEVAEEAGQGLGKRWRCPRELRRRIVSYARVCRDRGQTLGDISRRLGLVESTLARWLRAAKVEATDLAPAFRSVSLAGDEVAAYRGEVEPSLRLVTPRGYRVEGLDVATLAYLLQVVG